MGSPRVHSAQGLPIKGMGEDTEPQGVGTIMVSIMPSYCEFWLYLQEKGNQDVQLTAPRLPRIDPQVVDGYC